MSTKAHPTSRSLHEVQDAETVAKRLGMKWTACYPVRHCEQLPPKWWIQTAQIMSLIKIARKQFCQFIPMKIIIIYKYYVPYL